MAINKQRLHYLPTANFKCCMGCGKERAQCEKELTTTKETHWKHADNNCMKYGKHK